MVGHYLALLTTVQGLRHNMSLWNMKWNEGERNGMTISLLITYVCSCV